MKKSFILRSIIAATLMSPVMNNALAEHIHERPDTHAPIGVMGDHVMDKGEIMFSYRYMKMEMEGNREGTNRVSTPLPGFMVSPLKMDMDMHMFGGMYALSNQLTVAAMVPVVSTSMDHRVNMNGVEFNTNADGLGDISLTAIYKLSTVKSGDLLFNFVVSLPTGSIDERHPVPVSKGVPVQLPYPMQLGSGTYDVTPGLTYTQMHEAWSWGGQGLYTIRTGTNDNGYTLGDKLNVSTWVAKSVAKSMSLSFRLNAQDWGNIDGADTTLNPKPTVPTKRPDLRGGKRVDALIGINYVAAGLNHMRFAFEIGQPVYQDLNGPQLETDLVFTLGTQYTF